MKKPKPETELTKARRYRKQLAAERARRLKRIAYAHPRRAKKAAQFRRLQAKISRL